MNIALGRRIMVVASAVTLGSALLLGGIAGATGGSVAAAATDPAAADRPASEPAVRAAGAEHADGTVEVEVGTGGAFVAVQAKASGRPSFQVPFECGETWTGSAWSGHKPYYAVDFNHSPDYGWKVTASAAGTVRYISWASGYGTHVVIDHGNGWSTLYAHLSAANVRAKQSVKIGQVIGRVGNSGGHGKPMASHLHYEQRHHDNDTAAVFYGTNHVRYFSKVSYRVKCGGSEQPPTRSYPYSISQICGSSYRQIDSKSISGGKIVLAYSSSTGKNCVATMKSGKFTSSTKMSTFVRTHAKKSSDSGKFGYYAGPAKVAAKGTCVKWGGTIAGKSWTSKYEHCG